MQPSTFAEVLAGGDRRYRGQADVVVAAVMREPTRFDELFDVLFAEDGSAAARASYAVEQITRTRPDLLVPHRKRLFELVDSPAYEVRRCIAQVLPRVKLDAKDRSRAIRLLDDWFENAPPPVAAAAMTSLADYAAEDVAVRVKLVPKLERVAAGTDKSAALRATKVLAFLTRRAQATAASPAKRPNRSSR